jgi:TPR repeat protein
MLELYEKAAAKLHYKALNNLSGIYAFGWAGITDERRAIELTEQGIKRNWFSS